MKEPSVSVVMAVYNIGRKDILDAAIESIVHQDMDDWELLICDDASTDETALWLQWWTKRESRIRVFQNEQNLKAAAARNRCIREAKGAFIAIMDADDACTPNRLRMQREFLVSHKDVPFVGLRGNYFNRVPGDMEKDYWFCRRPEAKDFLMTLPFVHASIMFRKSDIMKMNCYLQTWRVRRSEDYDLLMRMYAQGLFGVNISDAVYYIREDENTYRRRKYRYRIIEMMTKLNGFSKMGLMPGGAVYAIKPLIVGLLPIQLLEYLKKRYYNK